MVATSPRVLSYLRFISLSHNVPYFGGQEFHLASHGLFTTNLCMIVKKN